MGMSFSMTRLSVAGAVVSAEVRHLGVITNGHFLYAGFNPAAMGMHRSFVGGSHLRGAGGCGGAAARC